MAKAVDLRQPLPEGKVHIPSHLAAQAAKNAKVPYAWAFWRFKGDELEGFKPSYSGIVIAQQDQEALLGSLARIVENEKSLKALNRAQSAAREAKRLENRTPEEVALETARIEAETEKKDKRMARIFDRWDRLEAGTKP